MITDFSFHANITINDRCKHIVNNANVPRLDAERPRKQRSQVWSAYHTLICVWHADVAGAISLILVSCVTCNNLILKKPEFTVSG